jgi:predicted Zn-dependent protease with MMP-like domain
MQSNPPTVRRVLFSALAAITIGLGAVSLIAGFSESFPVRLLQGLAVFASGAVIVGGAVVLVMIRLAGWRDPESETDFEALVQRTERLASEGGWDGDEDYDEDEDDEELFDPHNEEDFKLLVRRAIDDLPLEFHRALEHVAVVVSDSGRRARAYGLYQGDTVAQDYFHDRIVIFRHELAHHLGWDEKGVRGLGL